MPLMLVWLSSVGKLRSFNIRSVQLSLTISKGMGFTCMIVVAKVSNDDRIFASHLRRLITAFFALTLFTNLMGTCESI